MDALFQDLRYALRSLRKSAGFTLAAVMTLALGIGANTAMFQLLDAVQWRTLPVQRPNELVEIRLEDMTHARGSWLRESSLTNPIWERLRSDHEAFANLGAWADELLDVSTGSETLNATMLWAGGGLFQTLGIRAERGRLLDDVDDQRGCGAAVVVLSHAFWQSRFGGDPAVVGRPAAIGRMHPTVVGVAPPSFTGLEVGRAFDVVAPICSEPAWHGANVRLDSGLVWWLTVIGRLKPGVTFEQAATVLGARSPGVFEATVPANYPPASVGRYRTMRLVALSASHGLSRLRAQYAASLRLLFGVTALVLIIASVNLAHLARARASDRHHEMAVRRSLGASGFRLAQQFFAESVLLTAAGVAAGAWLARALCRLLIALLASDAPAVFLDLSMDWRTVSFMAAVATAAILVSGSIPLFHLMRGEPVRALTIGRQSVTFSDAAWLRRMLLSSQTAFSLVLLAAALVFARSLRNLEALAPGFQPREVVVADINFADLKLPSANAMTFRHDLVERIRTNPDVAAASETLILPVASGNWNNRMWLDGADRNGAQVVSRNMIGTAYFRTLSTRVVAGREFDERDLAAGAARVAIVNERFVRQFGLDLDAVGRHFRIETNQLEPEASYEIVGVVENTKYHDLREADQPIAYVPLSVAARRRPAGQLLVRGSATAGRAAAALKVTLGDANVRYTIRLFESIIRGTLVRERLMAAVAMPFGILATLLTAIGLYGVFAGRVARRTQEIGIRIALGATAAAIIVSVLRETVVVLSVGIICGALLTAAASRAASAFLFGVTTSDPLSLTAAAAALSAIALFAAYLPARRAARVDPIVALRAE